MSDVTSRILALKLELKDRRIAELIEERDAALMHIELAKTGLSDTDIADAIVTAGKLR